MSVIEEYNGPAPAPLKIQIVRGDTWKMKLFQAVDPLDGAPVSISEYTFILEVRESNFDEDSGEPLIRATTEEGTLFFGTSEEGLAADVASDELHVEVEFEKTKIDPGKWWWGVRAIDPNGHVELLVQDRIQVVSDVPKHSEDEDE